MIVTLVDVIFICLYLYDKIYLVVHAGVVGW